MTAHNIFETISSQYFQLTNSEKKVADYVLRHRIDVQYMSCLLYTSPSPRDA